VERESGSPFHRGFEELVVYFACATDAVAESRLNTLLPRPHEREETQKTDDEAPRGVLAECLATSAS
jgi:hypothetical protein